MPPLALQTGWEKKKKEMPIKTETIDGKSIVSTSLGQKITKAVGTILNRGSGRSRNDPQSLQPVSQPRTFASENSVLSLHMSF